MSQPGESNAASGAEGFDFTPPEPDDLLDAALSILDQEGWQGMSPERLAVITGLTPEQVATRFPTPAHVGAAALDRVLRRLPGEFADEIDARSELRDRLYSAIAHEIRMMTPYRRFMAQLMKDAANPFSRSATLQSGLIASYLSFIAEQIRIARSRGEISRWVFPSLAAGAFWLVHLRIIVFWLNDASEGSQKTHAQADRWITEFVAALRGPGTPVSPSPEEPATPWAPR